MIAHTLPILAVTVALGVGAVPMPAPQGVTALITPGTVLDRCAINHPGVYGISIQGVGSAAAASSAAAAGGPTAAGSGVIGGAASAASVAAAEGVAEKLRRRQAVPQIPDGQIQVVPALEPRAPEIPTGLILSKHLKSWRLGHQHNLTDNCIALGKAAGPGVAHAGPAAGCGSGAAGAATQITGGRVRAPRKRSSLEARQNGYPLRVTLKGGVLTDTLGRIGYIADNRQLQFDAPPQAGAIYTAGFSACPDGTLALGDSNVFYACGSSDFTNLYDALVFPDNCREVKLFLV